MKKKLLKTITRTNRINWDMFDVFLEFLRAHSAKTRYLNNIRAMNPGLGIVTTDDMYPRLLYRYFVEDWVTEAFTWEQTPEGRVYWANISRAWEEYCNDGAL